jgi:hypothetical protein
MLLALVPVVGAVAYAVSEPMLKGPGWMLTDQAASKLPFKLYRRLGLARITMPRRAKAPITALRLARQVAATDTRVEHDGNEGLGIAA